jgi:1,4-alpha-glucan branching enzyme
MHRLECDPRSFEWVIADDRSNSVFAFLRLAGNGAAPVLVACNMTPVPRYGYRIGVPRVGAWREIFNSDSGFYGGSNLGNGGQVHATAVSSHGRGQSLELVLPPVATVFLRPDGE